MNYVLSYKPTFSKPLSSLRKKVNNSNSNLFGFVQSLASSGNLFSLIKGNINSNNKNNNNKSQQNMTAQKDISNLSMFASSGVYSNNYNNNINNNEKNKAGKLSPTSITFTNEELEDIAHLNNKLSAYNHSPAHEFEILTSGLNDNTKSCKVVGFLDYDPLQAASATHKKNSRKSFFNSTK